MFSSINACYGKFLLYLNLFLFKFYTDIQSDMFLLL